jgi:regulator of protease activity HflC (stomatin/prohibitin superfamily)
MRDVVIPDALQDAMSRAAQASREKQARIILGEAEVEIAHLFEKAAQAYPDNPTALYLRAMNMLYEGLKEKGAMMIVPSTAVESMGMGGLPGAAALRQKQLSESGDETLLPIEWLMIHEPPRTAEAQRGQASSVRKRFCTSR